MINLTSKEFEDYIEDLINEKYSKQELLNLLQTDYRTLNNKIQELSVTNPELYLRYIKKYPYRQKERDDIDYEALIIESIRTGINAQDIANKYDVSVRTIQRKVAKLEKENPELVELYRIVRENNKTGAQILPKAKDKIGLLVQRPVKIADVNDSRRNYLLEIEKTFYERKAKYGTVAAAARSMGTTPDRIYKLLNELYRIEIERKTLEDDGLNETNISESDFKKRIKVELPKDGIIKINYEKSNTKSKQNIPEM